MNGTEEEFVPEEEAEEGTAALSKLREKLKKAVAEKQEYLEGWQRARADFTNYKREESALHAQKEDRLRADMAEAIIPALDAFEMAFATKWYKDAAPEWKGGVMSIYRELVRSLERFNIKLHTPLGEPFDPQKHEAVRHVPVDTKEQEDVVVSVERSGYTAGDRVIRPAQVSIGQFKQ